MPDTAQLPILGPGIAGRSRAISAQKRLNLYLEVRRDDDKSSLVAYGTPGLKLFSDLGAQPVRGMWWFEATNSLFAASYDGLFEINSDGTYTLRGTIDNTAGNVSMADNGLQLMLVNGPSGYIYTPQTAELPYSKPAVRNRSYSQTTTTVTFTEPASYVECGRATGDSVTITGATDSYVNGTFTITVVSATTWTITVGTSATSSGTADVTNTCVLVTETLQTRKTNQEVEIDVITGDLPSNTYTVVEIVEGATELITSTQYVIQTLGTSDFTRVGAELNEVGVVFTATGTTTGTGTCSRANEWLFEDGQDSVDVTGNLKVLHDFRAIRDTYTGVNFPGANTVAFIDSYFVINNPGTKQFWLSGQYDGFYWDTLQFASKEAYTDNLDAVTVDNGNIVLLGTISQEYWQNNGGFPFPFARISGSPTDVGLAARWSLARCGGMLFYLGRTRRGSLSVFSVQNYAPTVVSTPDLDYLFSQYQNPGDAVAFGYRQNGHEFYQISFPTEKKSWLYDATTEAWSELTSGSDSRHYSQFGAYYKGNTIVSDYRNGKLYILDPDYYTDNGDTIVRELITPHTFSNSSFNRLHIYRLRLDMEQGTGLAISEYTSSITSMGATETDPLATEEEDVMIIETSEIQTRENNKSQIMLQVSRDGGYTYGNEMWSNLGSIGQYLKRAEWRRLGVSRSFVFKFRITDPIKVVLIGAAAYITQAAK